MKRRYFLMAALTAPALAVHLIAAEPAATSVRGKLVPGPGNQPAVQTADGKLVMLSGDEPTLGVLHDKRVAGSDFEAEGRFTAPDRFTINPIHTPALFIYQKGKKLMVTYWCDVCFIRTYTPGKCVCCQEQTQLDLIDPDKVEKK